MRRWRESHFIAVYLRECHLPTYRAFQWDGVKEEKRKRGDPSFRGVAH